MRSDRAPAPAPWAIRQKVATKAKRANIARTLGVEYDNFVTQSRSTSHRISS